MKIQLSPAEVRRYNRPVRGQTALRLYSAELPVRFRRIAFSPFLNRTRQADPLFVSVQPG
jgi:hypothetical protein